MRAKLFSKQGTMKGKQFEFDNEVTIGRSEQNEIALDRKEVSKVHARIFLEPSKAGTPAAGCYYLEDLASANGTQLDGVKVHGKERLGHLHVITFSGAFDFIFIDNDLCKRRHPKSDNGQWTMDNAGTSPSQGSHHSQGTPPPQGTTPLAGVSSPPVGAPLAAPLSPQSIVDETVVEEKPFVLPQGFDQGKGVTTPTPAEPEDKTMVEEKPFVLPQRLGKGKEKP
jgi:hypothetical protein